MKKNKISFICVVVIALTLVSACGTGANESAKTDAIEVVEITEVPVEQESEVFVPTKEYPIEEQELSPFELILNSIYDSLKSDFTSEEICCDFLSTGIREVIAGQTADERMKAVAYCVKDINLDGVDELLILDPLYPEPGNVRILDMYTLIDGTAVKVIEGWARNRYYLLEDGMIYCSGSSGAAYSNEELLLFKDGSDKLTPTELYFTYPKGEDMDNGGFYYSPDGVYDVEAATEISADDFRAFCNECNQKTVEFEAKTFDSLKQRID